MVPTSYEQGEKSCYFASKYLWDLTRKEKEFNHNVVVGVLKKECECLANTLTF